MSTDRKRPEQKTRTQGGWTSEGRQSIRAQCAPGQIALGGGFSSDPTAAGQIDIVTSDLHGVDLSGATLARTNFFRCDLTGANVTGVDLTKAPYSLTSATPNFSNTAVVSFDGYGSPSSGGTVVLVAKSHTCTVTLNGTTGDVTITSSHTGGRTAQVAGN